MQSEGLSEDVDTSTLASIVWEHMQRVTINGELKAICKHRNIKLSVKKGIGTRHLLTHVKGCLRKKKKFLPKASQNVMIAKQEPDGKTTSNNYVLDQVESRRHLIGMISCTNILSIVDQVGFRKFMDGLQLFPIPCRNIVRSDIIELHEEHMKKTMSLLDNNEGRIAITTDLWIGDYQKKSYMTVTTQFVDDSWGLQLRLLR
jgi:hypothetical protein